MKATLKVRPNLLVEIEGDSQQALFRSIASAQEVFGERKCGKCGSLDLVFRTRKNHQEDEFFEMFCRHCHAALAFGVHKKGGTLFPKRRKEGDAGGVEVLPDNGWLRWDPERQQSV